MKHACGSITIETVKYRFGKSGLLEYDYYENESNKERFNEKRLDDNKHNDHKLPQIMLQLFKFRLGRI